VNLFLLKIYIWTKSNFTSQTDAVSFCSCQCLYITLLCISVYDFVNETSVYIAECKA